MLNIDRKIILGSSSPRRKELLGMIGLEFEVMKSDKEEIVDEKLAPNEVVKSLALIKAEDIITRVPNDAILITADTLVVCDGEILGKPKDEQSAYDMLKLISGKNHSVLTGIVVWDKETGKKDIDSVETKVHIKELSDEEIWAYIKTGDPMDKAGSYGAQTISSVFIDKIEGDFFNVVGLPVSKLYEILKNI